MLYIINASKACLYVLGSVLLLLLALFLVNSLLVLVVLRLLGVVQWEAETIHPGIFVRACGTLLLQVIEELAGFALLSKALPKEGC